jgi:hypothetical protein
MKVHLVVASLRDAAALETADAGAEGFRWFELRLTDFAHVAILRCLHDGVDPTAPIEPVVERKNPFTGEVFKPTVLDHALDTFEIMIDGELLSGKKVGEMTADGCVFEALVVRIPPAVVAWLARMSDATKSEVARAWARATAAVDEHDRRGSRSTTLSHEDAARALDIMVSASTAAVEAEQELFLWHPP